MSTRAKQVQEQLQLCGFRHISLMIVLFSLVNVKNLLKLSMAAAVKKNASMSIKTVFNSINK